MQPVTSAGETAWEELSIGFTTSQQVRVEAYVISTDSRDTWFDELKVEITDKPTAVVVQENAYYPFGQSMKGIDYTAPIPNTENKFTFNGKEKQSELGLNQYDYGARGFDYQLYRTTTLDPHADKYPNVSGYSFLNNNPLRFIDPTGMDVTVSGDNISMDGQDAQNAFLGLQKVSRERGWGKQKAEQEKTQAHFYDVDTGKYLETINASTQNQGVYAVNKQNFQNWRSGKEELSSIKFLTNSHESFKQLYSVAYAEAHWSLYTLEEHAAIIDVLINVSKVTKYQGLGDLLTKMSVKAYTKNSLDYQRAMNGGILSGETNKNLFNQTRFDSAIKGTMYAMLNIGEGDYSRGAHFWDAVRYLDANSPNYNDNNYFNRMGHDCLGVNGTIMYEHTILRGGTQFMKLKK